LMRVLSEPEVSPTWPMSSSRYGPSARAYSIHAWLAAGSEPCTSAFAAMNSAPVGECWKQNRTPSAEVSPGPNSGDVGYAVVPWYAQSAAGAVDNVPASSSPSRPHTLALPTRSEEHTSELQSRENLVCRLLLEKKKTLRLYLQLLHQNMDSDVH